MDTNIIVQKQKNAIDLSIIQSIHEIRGVRVILDFDLAERYEVETRVLNQAVKRNIRRFPDDFMFQLTNDEWKSMSSQIVMTSRAKRPKSSLPFAFTQEGVATLSGLLNSDIAIDINIKIMRAFVAIRQYVLNYAELKHELNNFMLKTNIRLDDNDVRANEISALLNELLAHKKELEKPRTPIGFRTSYYPPKEDIESECNQS
jgi:hypothetical protein